MMAARSLCLMVLPAMLIGCVLSNVASAAEDGAVYYVASNGDDGDPGTRQAPWRTPEHAGEMAAAGDTVIFLPGEYSGRLVPENSGTPDAPIVFRADQRRTARLVGHSPGELAVGPSGMQSLGGGARIEIEDRSHIEVRGFEVYDTAQSGGEGGWARIVGSSNITFADCSFSGGYVFRSFWVESSEQIAIINNNMSRDTIGSDLWGIVHSRRLLMEGNSFGRTGHGPGGIRNTQQAVVRGNVFHAGWARNLGIGPDNCSEILVEGNIFANQFNGGRAAGSRSQILGQQLILRFNATFDACGLAWQYQGSSGAAHLHNRTYHNVFHGNHAVALYASTRYSNFEDLVLQNNIFDCNDPYGSGTQLWLTGGGDATEFRDSPAFRLLRNVIYAGRADVNSLMLYGRAPLSLASVQGRDRWETRLAQPATDTTGAGSGRSLPVSDASVFQRLSREVRGPIAITVGEMETLAAVIAVNGGQRILQLDREIEWAAGDAVTLLTGPADDDTFVENMEIDPRFADPARLDFSLDGDSPLRDAGSPLTVTRAARSGDLLPVEDPYPFYDGYGIEGERGDVIAVGSPENRARVVEVDLETGTLRLDRRLEWAAEAPVCFPWSGAGPDIGIIEHGDGARPGVQVLADRVRVDAGQTVTLRAVVRGMTPPFEYEWYLGDGSRAHGQTITHRYMDGLEYGIRVRVRDADGHEHVGVGYVDAEPSGSDDVLIHTTFDADDQDWFGYWQTYRGRRATGGSSHRQVVDEETGEGYVRILTRGDEPWVLPALIRPRGWDIDRYPHVRIRYQIRRGTPVAIFVRPFPSAWYTLWDMDPAQDSRRYYFAGTPDVLDREPVSEGEDEPRGRGPLPDGPFPQQLIADGEWHEISFDVRDIRSRYPDVQVLQALDIGDLAVDGGAQVGSRDEFRLDEVYIGN
ncbi:MAG: PKD domain-containing protein [Armatimonadota bacterium]